MKLNKDFDTIDQLMDYVYDQVYQVIFHEIYEFVMNKLFKSIEENVFSVYTPFLYERRSLTEENEGLLNSWITLDYTNNKENPIMVIEKTHISRYIRIFLEIPS